MNRSSIGLFLKVCQEHKHAHINKDKELPGKACDIEGVVEYVEPGTTHHWDEEATYFLHLFETLMVLLKFVECSEIYSWI